MMQTIVPIAHIHTDMPTKFGVPRQSGLVESLAGRVVFAPDYRKAESLRGLDGFSHVWLLWLFDRSEGWHPTVRPPRLGGNVRMGVFATRSPFRPNPIGLSCVALERIEWDAPDGPALVVGGVDMADGTPIVDIKPYLPFADARPAARMGFAAQTHEVRPLDVVVPQAVAAAFDPARLAVLRQLLAADPRPHYHADADRLYVMPYAGREVRFRVDGTTLIVVDIAL